MEGEEAPVWSCETGICADVFVCEDAGQPWSHAACICEAAQNHCFGQKNAVVGHWAHPVDDIMSAD